MNKKKLQNANNTDLLNDENSKSKIKSKIPHLKTISNKTNYTFSKDEIEDLKSAFLFCLGEFKLDEAMLFAKTLIKNNPSNEEYWFYLSNVYLFTHQLDNAISAINKAIAIKPEASNFYALKVQALMLLNNNYEAQKVINEGLKYNEDDLELLLLRTTLYFQKFDIDKALDILYFLENKYDDERILIKIIQNLDFQTMDLTFKNLDKIESYYKKLTQKYSDSYEHWLNYGIFTMESKNNSKEALKIFEKADKLSPNNTDVLHYLGICYYNTKKRQKALACFQKIQNIEEEELKNGMQVIRIEDVNFFIGMCSYEFKNYDIAIHHFSLFIDKHIDETLELYTEKHRLSHIVRGECYIKLNKNKLAIKDFEIAIQIYNKTSPLFRDRSEDIYMDDISLELADLYLLNNQTSNAIKTIKKYLKNNYDDIDIIFRLVDIYLSKNKRKEAKDTLNEFIGRNKSPELPYRLAQLQYEEYEIELAHQAINHVLKILFEYGFDLDDNLEIQEQISKSIIMNFDKLIKQKTIINFWNKNLHLMKITNKKLDISELLIDDDFLEIFDDYDYYDDDDEDEDEDEEDVVEQILKLF